MDELEQQTANCGCCAGIDSETPQRIHNPPGLPAIAYRAGNHARFKESLLARLSGSAFLALTGLRTREDNDFTIALCDALATSLDVLTFYQERIANEHYLRTATERRSVLEMARLIGYEPAPGVAASTYLAFTLQETPGDTTQAPAPITIPVGTRVQSVPGPGEQPQTFETAEPVEARVEWNAIAAQTSEPWQPAVGDIELWLEGVSTQLQAGDAILIVGAERETDPGSEHWGVRVLDRVEADTANNRTRVTWTDGLGSVRPRVEPAAEAVRVFVFRQRAALFGHNAPDPNLMSTRFTNLSQLTDPDPANNSLRIWKKYQIAGTEIDLDVAYPKIIAKSWIALVSNQKNLGSASLPGYIELYRADKVYQISRTNFGLSSKITRIEPNTPENLTPERFTLHDTLVLAQSEELALACRPLFYPIYGDHIALDGRIDGLVTGQAVVITGKCQRLAIAPGVNHLQLKLDDGGATPLAENDSLALLAAPLKLVGVTSEPLDPETFWSLLECSEDRLRLRLQDRDGHRGSLIAMASELILDASQKADPLVTEIAFIATGSDDIIYDRDRTTLRFTDPLKRCYERGTVRLNANVTRATHGETVDKEILGNGDARLSDQHFLLRQSPLTYVSAVTPTGRASTLSLRVNDLLWKEASTFYGRRPDERVYTMSVDDSGVSTVRFGDGVEGARPPSGQNNIRTTYRKGIGVGGNVAAGKLTTLLDRRPVGVNGVSNPEAATSGEDPETLDQARGNAPLTVLTLERAVSVKDYANFARAFAGIAKAHALWILAGPARGIFLTVAGIDGAPVPEGSDTYKNLHDALKIQGDPLMPVHLRSYRPARFRARLSVRVGAEYESDRVLAAAKDALCLAFDFNRRAFGQGVSLDEMVTVVHTVSGVEAVRVSQLYRLVSGVLPNELRQQHLPAALPVATPDAIPEAAELLTLADESLELGVLS